MSQSTKSRLAREERRAQIVEAATQVFRDRDPAEVTFEEIADAAGVSRALVYNYFGDRHGLLEAVYQQSVNELRERIDNAVRGSTSLAPTIRGAVRAHLEFARDDPSAYRYSCGDGSFAHLPEVAEDRVSQLRDLLGGGPRAEVVARGMIAALQAMVLHWVKAPAMGIDEMGALISGQLIDGLANIDALGLRFQPWWFVPA